MANARDAATLVKSTFGQAVLAEHDFRGDVTLVVRKDAITGVLQFLRDDPRLRFDMLIDLTAVDYLEYQAEPKAQRFEVVYHLRSMASGARLRLKAPVPEDDCQLPSAAGLFNIANWLEREVWDMMGITFTGHPNLIRLLMYEGFAGHPLRKDYPYNKEQPLFSPWERPADRHPLWVR